MLQKVCKWQVRLLFTRVSRNWLYVLNTLIVIILGFGGVGAVFGGPQRLDLMKLGVFDDDGGVLLLGRDDDEHLLHQLRESVC